MLGSDPFTPPLANFVSQNSLTQAILNERRIEFAGEGRRWPDITRLSQDPNFAVTGGGMGRGKVKLRRGLESCPREL